VNGHTCESERSYMWEWTVIHVRVNGHTCESERSYMWEWTVIHVRVNGYTCESERSYMCVRGYPWQHCVIHVCQCVIRLILFCLLMSKSCEFLFINFHLFLIALFISKVCPLSPIPTITLTINKVNNLSGIW
jgi:hypothetical protein